MKKGFTLMELLIVGTLLSILAAFAMGTYRASMRQARLENLKNVTRSVMYGLLQFREEYPGVLENLSSSMSSRNLKWSYPKNSQNFVDYDSMWEVDRDNFWMLYICEDAENINSPYCYYNWHESGGEFVPFLCLSQYPASDWTDPKLDDTYFNGSYEFCISETGEEREYHVTKSSEVR